MGKSSPRTSANNVRGKHCPWRIISAGGENCSQRTSANICSRSMFAANKRLPRIGGVVRRGFAANPREYAGVRRRTSAGSPEIFFADSAANPRGFAANGCSPHAAPRTHVCGWRTFVRHGGQRRTPNIVRRKQSPPRTLANNVRHECCSLVFAADIVTSYLLG